MRCDSCGKEISNDEEPVFDTTNVPTGPGGKYAYTYTTHVWRCNDCAAYRRSTFQLLYWLVGAMLGLGIFFAAIRACS